MSQGLRIYIAGAYTAATEGAVENNVRAAIDAGIELFKRGHHPYIPHLTHFVELRSQETNAGLSWDDYLKWDRVWLKQCDAFLLLSRSRGADLELGWAEERGIPVFYHVEDVPAALVPA